VKRLMQFLIFGSVMSFVLVVAVGASGSGAKSAVAIPDFTVAQVSAPSGANWITHNGNVQAWRYSTLSQINASNGSSLKLAWTMHLADPATREQLAPSNESPIVYNGVTYVQDGWMRVTALDGASGKILWQFDPKISLDQGGGSSSGGTARSIGMGGGMIFETAYGSVYALNSQTGAQVWATQVVDPIGGANIDVSPLYYKGLVVFGTSGGDSGASCIDVAIDAKTGKIKWHYSNIPSNPKAYGWNTWPSQRWYYGGGAIWDPPSIDPTLDMVYYGTGQPLPFNGLINGPGAEYGTDGVYGLNVLTGKFVWWFQEVHHDIWDYDAMATPTVVTITHNGKKIHVVDHVNKDGYNYVLDAKTGKPVLGVVETPVPQDPLAHTYPTQPIPVGDELVPHVVPDPQSYQGVLAPDGKPYLISTQPFPAYTDQQYVVGAPTAGGGVEWPEGAYDPNTGWIIWCANVQSQGFESPPAADQHPVIKTLGFGNMTQLRSSTPANALTISRLVAFNPATNKIVWKHDDVSTGGIAKGNSSSCASTVTTTGSGLALIGRTVATSQYPNGVGMIQAYSVKDVSFLWQFTVLINGQGLPSVPRITPYSVNGKEYIVSYFHLPTAGPDVSAFTLP
jgi:quinohemoprotein ethanol dehydrogenase